MILDDGGDATHLMLKKHAAAFKHIKGMIFKGFYDVFCGGLFVVYWYTGGLFVVYWSTDGLLVF